MSLPNFTREEYNNLDFIFIGTVIDTYYDNTIKDNITKFKIEKLYKGSVSEDYIYVRNTHSTCRLTVEKHDVFLLFLYEYDGYPEVSICSRRVKIAKLENYTPPSYLIYYSNTPNGFSTYFNEQNQLECIGEIRNNYPTGNWKYYYSNGNLKSEGLYQNGQKDSIWNYFNSKGKITEINSYKNGKLHGNSISYHENSIESICQYSEGLQSGICNYYYPNGNLLSENIYRNDTLVTTRSFSVSGVIEHLKNDSLEIYNYDNGNPRVLTKFKNNHKCSQLSWWENGLMKKSVIFTEMGLEKVSYIANEDGQIMVEKGSGHFDLWGIKGEYKDSLQVGTWLQEFGGGNIEETYYNSGLKDGVFKTWNKSGGLIIYGEYNKNQRSGIWLYWYDNGQISQERDFSNGRNHLINSWKPDGTQMVKDGNGVHIFFNNDGTESSIGPYLYENGESRH